MDTDDELFARHRSELLSVAYRMLGSVGEAEDVVQDVFERWIRRHREQSEAVSKIDNPVAYLITMTTRRSLDRLGSAQKRRETYPGPWLAEPIQTDDDPARIVELGESATIGFMYLLDKLSPAERAVHLLREVFGFSYREVAAMIDRSEPNCRQIARRARVRIAETRSEPWTPPPVETESEIIQQFIGAISNGDAELASSLLAAGAVSLSDGGPDRHAARVPIVGPDRIARFYTNLAKRFSAEPDRFEIDFLRVNNQPALSMVDGGNTDVVVVFEIDQGRIQKLFALLNPDKLARFDQDATLNLIGSAPKFS